MDTKQDSNATKRNTQSTETKDVAANKAADFASILRLDYDVKNTSQSEWARLIAKYPDRFFKRTSLSTGQMIEAVAVKAILETKRLLRNSGMSKDDVAKFDWKGLEVVMQTAFDNLLTVNQSAVNQLLMKMNVVHSPREGVETNVPLIERGKGTSATRTVYTAEELMQIDADID